MKKRILSLIMLLCVLLNVFGAFSITVDAATNYSRNITGRVDFVYVYNRQEIDIETTRGDEKVYYADKFKEKVKNWETGAKVTLTVDENNYLVDVISYIDANNLTSSKNTRNITGTIDFVFVHSGQEIDIETAYGYEIIYYGDKFINEVKDWEEGKKVTLKVNEDDYLVEIISYNSQNNGGKQTSTFSDVSGKEYYADSVKMLASQGIISGYSDGSFKPKGTITRAEFAAIICRMIGKKNDAQNSSGKKSFDDVSRDHWASGYIAVASKEGIVNGDGKGNFRPEASVKYEEAIKMVVCALDLAEENTSYPDGYIDIANKLGITRKLKGGRGEAATRGEVAMMINYGLQAIDSDLGVKKLEKDALTVSSWSDEGIIYKDYNNKYNSEYSYCLFAEKADDLRLEKSFNVKKNTWYSVSAYFKTENVKNYEENKIGANISSGDWVTSPTTLFGNNEWTKIKLVINSGEEDTISASFNLGYWSNSCSGKVYVDGIECEELKPEKDSNWKLLFVILKETDIAHVSHSGKEIRSSNVMSSAEINILKEAAEICEVDFGKYSNGLMNSSIDVVVIEDPLIDVDDYGENEIFLSPEKAYDFLKNKVDVDKYDHVTVFSNLNMPTSYFGLGGVNFEQLTGYSFINTQGKEYSLWAFDKNEVWVSGCMIHEFLHFIEAWSSRLGEPLAIALHDAEKLGYTDKDEWKTWYRDFMTKKVVFSDGSYTGVSPVVWKYPPRLFR